MYKKGSAKIFIIFTLSLFLGVFWFLGKEAYKTENLKFSVMPTKEDGDAAIIQLDLLKTGSSENVTSSFTENVVNKYYNPLKTSAEDVPTNEIVDSFYKSIKDAGPENIPYIKLEDLNIVQPGTTSAKSYMETIKKIESDLVFEDLGREAELYTRYALTGTEEEVSNAIIKLRKSEDVYKEMAERLSKMDVPENFAKNHVILTNAILDLSYGSKYLADGLLDPILSILGVHFYQKGVLARGVNN